MYVKIFVLLLVVFISSGFPESIKFAPLPIKPKEELIGEHIPLVEYLKDKTGLNVEIVYIDSYEKMIEEFKKGNIQMITIGALPYVKLTQEYREAQAIVHFKEKNGSSFYRCVLVTTSDGPKSVKELKGAIALPQRLSTCGTFSVSIILSTYSKDLNKLGYKNFKDHTQAMEAMLRGEFEAAMVKEDVAQEYTGYGIKVLAESPTWPSFSVVVNTKSLTQEKVNSIKNALLSASWKDLRKFVIGKYGFSEAKKEDYEEIYRYKKYIP